MGVWLGGDGVDLWADPLCVRTCVCTSIQVISVRGMRNWHTITIYRGESPWGQQDG